MSICDLVSVSLDRGHSQIPILDHRFRYSIIESNGTPTIDTDTRPSIPMVYSTTHLFQTWPSIQQHCFQHWTDSIDSITSIIHWLQRLTHHRLKTQPSIDPKFVYGLQCLTIDSNTQPPILALDHRFQYLIVQRSQLTLISVCKQTIHGRKQQTFCLKVTRFWTGHQIINLSGKTKIVKTIAKNLTKVSVKRTLKYCFSE